ncbi:TPA: hypothetical protein HA344_08620, partial [Candidatus Bathyarchaeota archaeon]|nr:hypothetical protein [Candidatus Bathyarchaeota archaeon]
MERKKFDTVDEYIASYPPEVRVILEKIRGIVRKAVQGAEEKISYGMPTFKMGRNLVHFAAFKGHIGLYSTPSATGVFAKELEPYESGKGSIRFPLDNPIPYDLIKRIVEFRVKEE